MGSHGNSFVVGHGPKKSQFVRAAGNGSPRPRLSGKCVLLYFIDPRVKKIRNEASSCPGIFSRTLCFYKVAVGHGPNNSILFGDQNVPKSPFSAIQFGVNFIEFSFLKSTKYSYAVRFQHILWDLGDLANLLSRNTMGVRHFHLESIGPSV